MVKTYNFLELENRIEMEIWPPKIQLAWEKSLFHNSLKEINQQKMQVKWDKKPCNYPESFQRLNSSNLIKEAQKKPAD